MPTIDCTTTFGKAIKDSAKEVEFKPFKVNNIKVDKELIKDFNEAFEGEFVTPEGKKLNAREALTELIKENFSPKGRLKKVDPKVLTKYGKTIVGTLGEWQDNPRLIRERYEAIKGKVVKGDPWNKDMFTLKLLKANARPTREHLYRGTSTLREFAQQDWKPGEEISLRGVAGFSDSSNVGKKFAAEAVSDEFISILLKTEGKVRTSSYVADSTGAYPEEEERLVFGESGIIKKVVEKTPSLLEVTIGGIK